MTRVILSIDDQDKSWLQRKAREKGVSMAELMRQAVRHMQRSEGESLEKVLEATRGVWREGDGLRYQRRIRREWDDRLTRLGNPD